MWVEEREYLETIIRKHREDKSTIPGTKLLYPLKSFNGSTEDSENVKQHFPNINFKQSIMVGNRTSDMHFGRNAGLHTVFLATTHPETPYPDPIIDYRFDNLLTFAKSL